ncbi:MAG: TonB family protein [Gammaproteobacteria bacterium]|nr:TonB family protein [Gammaproteobacteria bacterium]
MSSSLALAASHTCAEAQSGGTWSAAAARDRLSSTLFLAALVHGILILGVTFTAQPPSRDPAATSLDVVIVTRDYARAAVPLNSAALLAAQNLVGRGNAALDARLRTAVPADLDLAAPGPDQAGVLHPPGNAGTPLPAQQRLTAAAREHPAVRTGRNGALAQPAARRQLQAAPADVTDILADPDTATVIPDARPRELLVSASTREARIAGYLNSWKMKVERIGTLNFPGAEQLATIDTPPVLEVAITADGSLKEIVVRNSSGYRNLDQAAMEILRIAAPFEPFPQVLREDYDVLRFAYEWHFGSGSGIGRVRTLHGS